MFLFFFHYFLHILSSLQNLTILFFLSHFIIELRKEMEEKEKVSGKDDQNRYLNIL